MTDLDLVARDGLKRLALAGADEGVCSVVSGKRTEFYYEGGRLGLLRTVENVSFSVKTLVGKRKGTSSVNSFDCDRMDAAVQEAVSAAHSSKEDDAEGLADVIAQKEFRFGPTEPDCEKMLEYFRAFFDLLAAEYPSVSVDTATIYHVNSKSVYRTTNGICYTVEQGYYGFSPMFMAREGEKTSSFRSFGAVFFDLDRPLAELADGRRILDQTVLQVSPEALKGKFVGDVILSPDCFGGLLGAVESNFLSDGVLIDGTGIWNDSLGSAVASPLLTWSSQPRNEQLASCYPVHGGYEMQNMDLIRDGVLCNFVLSRYGAAKTGRKRSPSAGGCYVVEAGTSSLDEMIASVKHGLLVGRFSGGNPSGDGTLSTVAKNSFEIRDGKIVSAVNEAMISGNLAEMLQNIRQISAERVNDGDSILPWVTVSNVTVSGKE